MQHPFGTVPERFLRQVWKHRQFSTTNLHTVDQQPVEILNPGTLNQGGGPDFLDAAIRIGGTLYRGNVEVHRKAADWKGHSHHTDPHYNPVILHVVLAKPRIRTRTNGNGHAHDDVTAAPLTASRRSIPTLALEEFIGQKFFAGWGRLIASDQAEQIPAIKCAPRNNTVDSDVILRWVERLGAERMELKMRRFGERLRAIASESKLAVSEPACDFGEPHFGIDPSEIPPPAVAEFPDDVRSSAVWNQLLYEGILEAFGYARNRESFLTLARNASLEFLGEQTRGLTFIEAVDRLEAILFGVSGFLTHDVSDGETRRYIRILRKEWKRCRGRARLPRLYYSDWEFFRLRPENFPTIRIAGAARIIPLILRSNLIRQIVRSLKNDGSPEFRTLCALFIIPADGYWQNHYRFCERSTRPVRTLIGRQRATDIVINVIIPIALLYARIFRDKEVRMATLDVLRDAPASAENGIIVSMKKQLVKERFRLDTASRQQGVMQLYKTYCLEGRCGECAVGKAVIWPAHLSPFQS